MGINIKKENTMNLLLNGVTKIDDNTFNITDIRNEGFYVAEDDMITVKEHTIETIQLLNYATSRVDESKYVACDGVCFINGVPHAELINRQGEITYQNLLEDMYELEGNLEILPDEFDVIFLLENNEYGYGYVYLAEDGNYKGCKLKERLNEEEILNADEIISERNLTVYGDEFQTKREALENVIEFWTYEKKGMINTFLSSEEAIRIGKKKKLDFVVCGTKFRTEIAKYFDSLSSGEFKELLIQSGFEVEDGEGRIIFTDNTARKKEK